ncbi:dTMP kinase [Falsirhodobacter xinxiangensis]|uniref:dTMP kinase n=1 Tax=Falsirhodobacter xinxiangensis TaxID=2530049 RepID=UPI0010AA0CA5|nr:dTMP kinase [Rhodobacter xinxiangensis]
MARFIAVEGIDGSGKTGVVRAIAQAIPDALTTREPGGTPQGDRLRGLLLAGDGAAWDPMSELLMMTAARVEHVRRVIRPALDAGRTVVSDRFLGSTLAYQGAGRGMDAGLIRDLHDRAVGGILPDLTIVLDLDPAIGLSRSRKRLSAEAVDEGRFESLDLAFHSRVRQSYLDQAHSAPERHAIIDAASAPEIVAQQVLAALAACCKPAT